MKKKIAGIILASVLTFSAMAGVKESAEDRLWENSMEADGVEDDISQNLSDVKDGDDSTSEDNEENTEKEGIDLSESDTEAEEDPSEAKYEFGTVDIIETGDYDTDSIEWGKVQALAGRMAVDWIMKSIELGQAGKIDAVSTAPIHKGAIKLIGVKEPGHTEIYQNVTHSPYALTMFS